ncbi:MAG: molybdopterin molybdenumtransferase MoeA, partial [Eggerthellaceae bacterium]|nr:molybdopterin molybdenumtransferase MoeA [Eggerthellaceae bacterium]
TPIVYGVVEDDKESITKTILQATKECDFVLTTGGASMGDFDYVAPIAESQGELFFHFVNMRPGKSQVFAIINETPFLGLAGNPSATAVGFEILARPALRKMQGAQHIFRPVQDARIAHPITKKAKRRHYMRGVAYRNEYDELVVEQAGSQSSAQLSALAHGNCLMMVMPDQIPVEAGEEIEIIRIDLPDGAAL